MEDNDVDESCEIKSYPTLIIYKNKQKIQTIEGANIKALKKIIVKNKPKIAKPVAFS